MSLFKAASNYRQKFKTRQLKQETYEWFALLQSGDISEEEFQNYLDWAEKYPEFARQVEQLEVLWEKAAQSSISKPLTLGSNTGIIASLLHYFWTFFRHPVTLSGLTAILFIIALDSFFIKQEPAQAEGRTYQTARAETMTVNLPDGSVASLNVLSSIEVIFTSQDRHINLNEGEASFTVIPDSNRPFIVNSYNNRVQAIGTEFNMKIEDESALLVTLVNGEIEISRTIDNNITDDTRLSEPGLQARLELNTITTNARRSPLPPITLTNAELSNVLSWRQGQLIFDGTPLDRAINEINRHTTHSIQLLSVTASDFPVFGVFNSGDWQGFISAIEQSYPVKVENVGPDLTLISNIE